MLQVVYSVTHTSFHGEWLHGSLKTGAAVLKERRLEISVVSNKCHSSASHVDCEHVSKLENHIISQNWGCRLQWNPSKS